MFRRRPYRNNRFRIKIVSLCSPIFYVIKERFLILCFRAAIFARKRSFEFLAELDFKITAENCLNFFRAKRERRTKVRRSSQYTALPPVIKNLLPLQDSVSCRKVPPIFFCGGFLRKQRSPYIRRFRKADVRNRCFSSNRKCLPEAFPRRRSGTK